MIQIVKVFVDQKAGRCDLVSLRHGEKLSDGSTYMPVPLCRLFVGCGRPRADVERDAKTMATLWNAAAVITEFNARAEAEEAFAGDLIAVYAKLKAEARALPIEAVPEAV